MAKQINEETQVTLDFKTIGIILMFVVSVVGMWYALQSDIQEAKSLPEPPISRTEYELKDKLIRETIMNTQQKVEENGEKLDKIEERIYELNKN